MGFLGLLAGLFTFLLGLFRRGQVGEGKDVVSGSDRESVVKLEYDVVFNEDKLPVELEVDEASAILVDNVLKVKSKPFRVRLPIDVSIGYVHEKTGERAYVWGESSVIEMCPVKVAGLVSFRDSENVFVYQNDVKDGSRLLLAAEFEIPPLEFIYTPRAGTGFYSFTYVVTLPEKTVEKVLPPPSLSPEKIEEVEGFVERKVVEDKFSVTLSLEDLYRLWNKLSSPSGVPSEDIDTRPPEIIQETLSSWIYPSENLVYAEGEKRKEKLENVSDRRYIGVHHNLVIELEPLHSSLSAFVYVKTDKSDWTKVVEYSDDAYALRHYGVLGDAEKVYVSVYVFPKAVQNPVAFRGVEMVVEQNKLVPGGGYAYERTVLSALKNLSSTGGAGIMFYRDKPDRVYSVKIRVHETAEIKWQNYASIHVRNDVVEVGYFPAIGVGESDVVAVRSGVYASVIVVDKDGITKFREDFVTTGFSEVKKIPLSIFGEGDKIIVRTHGIVKSKDPKYLLFVWNAGDEVYKIVEGRAIKVG